MGGFDSGIDRKKLTTNSMRSMFDACFSPNSVAIEDGWLLHMCHRREIDFQCCGCGAKIEICFYEKIGFRNPKRE